MAPAGRCGGIPANSIVAQVIMGMTGEGEGEQHGYGEAGRVQTWTTCDS